MKTSISRKGVDSGTRSGRMASPILPCGCLCSIPIPSEWPGVRYSDVQFGARNLWEIVRDLTPNRADEIVHLDPDLRHDALARTSEGWRPAFGQSGAAARHLINQNVGGGDPFIFFGWFRRTVVSDGKLRFDPADLNGRHMVFGWLEIGEVVDKRQLPSELSFLEDHPHVRHFEKETPPNRIYVSSKEGLKAGVFRTEAESIVLTQAGGGRSRWLLDEAFESLFLRGGLTYHGNKDRWKKTGNKIALKSVARGQEFVFDGDQHADAKNYFIERIKAMLSKAPRACTHDF
jgi:Nucleotide modification associated domain 3